MRNEIKPHIMLMYIIHAVKDKMAINFISLHNNPINTSKVAPCREEERKNVTKVRRIINLYTKYKKKTTIAHIWNSQREKKRIIPKAKRRIQSHIFFISFS